MTQQCCVQGCLHSRRNSSCTLKRFPTDPQKSQLWESLVQRAQWRRSPYDRICECHFDDNQFERNRQDGLRKLRWDAVPSLFGSQAKVPLPRDNVKGSSKIQSADSTVSKIIKAQTLCEEAGDEISNVSEKLCLQSEAESSREVASSEQHLQIDLECGEEVAPQEQVIGLYDLDNDMEQDNADDQPDDQPCDQQAEQLSEEPSEGSVSQVEELDIPVGDEPVDQSNENSDEHRRSTLVEEPSEEPCDRVDVNSVVQAEQNVDQELESIGGQVVNVEEGNESAEVVNVCEYEGEEVEVEIEDCSDEEMAADGVVTTYIISDDLIMVQDGTGNPGNSSQVQLFESSAKISEGGDETESMSGSQRKPKEHSSGLQRTKCIVIKMPCSSKSVLELQQNDIDPDSVAQALFKSPVHERTDMDGEIVECLDQQDLFSKVSLTEGNAVETVGPLTEKNLHYMKSMMRENESQEESSEYEPPTTASVEVQTVDVPEEQYCEFGEQFGTEYEEQREVEIDVQVCQEEEHQAFTDHPSSYHVNQNNVGDESSLCIVEQLPGEQSYESQHPDEPGKEQSESGSVKEGTTHEPVQNISVDNQEPLCEQQILEYGKEDQVTVQEQALEQRLGEPPTAEEVEQHPITAVTEEREQLPVDAEGGEQHPLVYVEVEQNHPATEEVEDNIPVTEEGEEDFSVTEGGEDNIPVTEEEEEDNILVIEEGKDNIPVSEEGEVNICVTAEGEQNIPATEEVEENTPATEEVKENTPAPDKVEENIPATEEVEGNIPAAEEMEENIPVTEKGEQNIPVTEGGEQSIPVTEEKEQNLPVPEEEEQNLPLTDEVEHNLPVTDGAEQNLPAADTAEQNLSAADDVEQSLPAADEAEQQPSVADNADQQPPVAEEADQQPLVTGEADQPSVEADMQGHVEQQHQSWTVGGDQEELEQTESKLLSEQPEALQIEPREQQQAKNGEEAQIKPQEQLLIDIQEQPQVQDPEQPQVNYKDSRLVAVEQVSECMQQQHPDAVQQTSHQPVSELMNVDEEDYVSTPDEHPPKLTKEEISEPELLDESEKQPPVLAAIHSEDPEDLKICRESILKANNKPSVQGNILGQVKSAHSATLTKTIPLGGAFTPEKLEKESTQMKRVYGSRERGKRCLRSSSKDTVSRDVASPQLQRDLGIDLKLEHPVVASSASNTKETSQVTSSEKESSEKSNNSQEILALSHLEDPGFKEHRTSLRSKGKKMGNVLPDSIVATVEVEGNCDKSLTVEIDTSEETLKTALVQQPSCSLEGTASGSQSMCPTATERESEIEASSHPRSLKKPAPEKSLKQKTAVKNETVNLEQCITEEMEPKAFAHKVAEEDKNDCSKHPVDKSMVASRRRSTTSPEKSVKNTSCKMSLRSKASSDPNKDHDESVELDPKITSEVCDQSNPEKMCLELGLETQVKDKLSSSKASSDSPASKQMLSDPKLVKSPEKQIPGAQRTEDDLSETNKDVASTQVSSRNAEPTDDASSTRPKDNLHGDEKDGKEKPLPGAHHHSKGDALKREHTQKDEDNQIRDKSSSVQSSNMSKKNLPSSASPDASGTPAKPLDKDVKSESSSPHAKPTPRRGRRRRDTGNDEQTSNSHKRLKTGDKKVDPPAPSRHSGRVSKSTEKALASGLNFRRNTNNEKKTKLEEKKLKEEDKKGKDEKNKKEEEKKIKEEKKQQEEETESKDNGRKHKGDQVKAAEEKKADDSFGSEQASTPGQTSRRGKRKIETDPVTDRETASTRRRRITRSSESAEMPKNKDSVASDAPSSSAVDREESSKGARKGRGVKRKGHDTEETQAGKHRISVEPATKDVLTPELLAKIAKMCRVCGTEQDSLINVFGPEGKTLQLSLKIHNHLPVTISEAEPLPVSVCHSCVVTLIACESLVEKSIQVDKRLREWFNCPAQQVSQVQEVADTGAAEDESAEPDAAEPSSVNTNIVELAAPVQAAPVQAAPVQAAPVQAAPVQAAPVQAAPVQAAPVQAAPVQAAPVQAGPTQAPTAQADPAQTALAPTAPAKAAPEQDALGKVAEEPESAESVPKNPPPPKNTRSKSARAKSISVQSAQVPLVKDEGHPVQETVVLESTTLEPAAAQTASNLSVVVQSVSAPHNSADSTLEQNASVQDQSKSVETSALVSEPQSIPPTCGDPASPEHILVRTESATPSLEQNTTCDTEPLQMGADPEFTSSVLEIDESAVALSGSADSNPVVPEPLEPTPNSAETGESLNIGLESQTTELQQTLNELATAQEDNDVCSSSPMKRFGNTYRPRVKAGIWEKIERELEQLHEEPSTSTSTTEEFHIVDLELNVEEPGEGTSQCPSSPKSVVDSILGDWSGDDEESGEKVTTVITLADDAGEIIVPDMLAGDSGNNVGNKSPCLFEGEEEDDDLGQVSMSKADAKPGEINLKQESFWPEPTPGQDINQTSGKDPVDVSWKCSVCGARGKSIHKFLEHKKSHQNDRKLINCSMCSESFTNNRLFSMHMKMHIGDDDEDQGSEVDAGKEKMLKPTIKPMKKKILRVEVDTDYTPKADGQYQCSECHNTFTEVESLREHKALHTKDPIVFKCIVCKRTFFQRKEFQEHMNTHAPGKTQVGMFQCAKCDVKLSTQKEFLEHLSVHAGSVDKYHCELCNKDFENRSKLRSHNSTVHKGVTYGCHLCDKVYHKRISLVEHIRKHTGENPYACEVCDKRFNRLANYKAHMMIHENARRYECPYCGKRFNRQSIQQRHIKTHTSEPTRTHRCRVCETIFPTAQEMQTHRKAHTREEAERAHWLDEKQRMALTVFPCKVCKKEFQFVEDVLLHMPEHTEDERDIALKLKNPKLECDICGKILYSKRTFNTHRSSHIDGKPYSCKICGKGYATSAGLNYHILSHTGERPFQCTFCAKGYKNTNDLKIHMRTHTGEFPFKCNLCNKAFRSASSLMKHGDVHKPDRPFKCQYCGLGFKRECTKVNHERIHTNDRRYKCKVCNRSFIQKGACDQHEKLHFRNTGGTDISMKTLPKQEQEPQFRTIEIVEEHDGQLDEDEVIEEDEDDEYIIYEDEDDNDDNENDDDDDDDDNDNDMQEDIDMKTGGEKDPLVNHVTGVPGLSITPIRVSGDPAPSVGDDSVHITVL